VTPRGRLGTDGKPLSAADPGSLSLLLQVVSHVAVVAAAAGCVGDFPWSGWS
jgi:hypothetical protein